MKLLVTGGAGFIGSNFVRYLLAKYPDYDVRVLDALTYAGNQSNLADVWENPLFSFVQGRIEDAQTVEAAARGCDAIINFAAESHNDRTILEPGAAMTANFMGVFVLLEAARKVGSKFFQISTDEVYGSTDGVFTEGDPMEPNQPYSAAKAGGDLLTRAYHETYRVPTLLTRGSNTFGPFQYPEKLIPLMVTNAIDDLPLPIYGDGLQVRDWLFVEDHCAGIDLVLHNGTPGEVYNLGGNCPKPNLEVVKAILALLDKSESLLRRVPDRPGHDKRYAMNTQKIQSLGFQTTGAFEARLEETVRWYVDNEPWWRAIKEKQADYQTFMKKWYEERQ